MARTWRKERCKAMGNRKQEVEEGAGPKGAEEERLMTLQQTDSCGIRGKYTEQGISARVGKKGKERKMPRKGKGENKGDGGQKGKGGKNFFPAPDCDGPIVKMRNQLEICKMKGGREITIEVTTKWFNEMEIDTARYDRGKCL